jgi:hypothetical protein
MTTKKSSPVREWFRRHIKKTLWAVGGILLIWLVLEVFRIWGEHTLVNRFNSVINEFREAVSENNGILVQARKEIGEHEKNVSELLEKVRENIRTENDLDVDSMPEDLPPVVLAIFPPTETSRPLLEGLQLVESSKNSQLTSRCTIEYLQEGASPDDTIKEIRSRFSKENIVLIIGHESSQTAKEINERLYEAKEFVERASPVPLILPATTNPELTKSPSRGIHHILRLPANDEKQIMRIKDLLGPNGLNSKRVTLVVDSSNLAYANYIARGLILGKDPVKIVDAVGVGLAGDGFSPNRFMISDPDTIVFIGMDVHANLMLRRMAEDTLPTHKKKLNLIFTDGVAGNAFETLSRDISARFAQKVRIFITGPFPTTIARGDRIDSLPNFRQYGAAARELAEYLVTEAHDVKERITRGSVLKVLQKRLNNGAGTKLAGLTIRFDANGDVVEGEEHVYEQGSKQAKHSTLCSCGR